MTKLVILRGNSGCGKTTVAQALRDRLNVSTMIVSQDVIRRDILNVKDIANNNSIPLMKEIISFGINRYDVIILEGILTSSKYRDFLLDLETLVVECYYYYFDVSFDTTYKRHLLKQTDEFGMQELKAWWVENDVLNLQNESLIYDDANLESIINKITSDLGY